MARSARAKSSPSPASSDAEAQPTPQQGAPRTRERILQAARELVLDEGASRLTLDAVVARAGLSKGAFLTLQHQARSIHHVDRRDDSRL
ncbi:TetR family transcriptional regulator [Pseudomonas aeruginosa]